MESLIADGPLDQGRAMFIATHVTETIMDYGTNDGSASVVRATLS